MNSLGQKDPKVRKNPLWIKYDEKNLSIYVEEFLFLKILGKYYEKASEFLLHTHYINHM